MLLIIVLASHRKRFNVIHEQKSHAALNGRRTVWRCRRQMFKRLHIGPVRSALRFSVTRSVKREVPTMADTAAAPAASPKKKAAAKKARSKPSHPPTNEMVAAAIKALKERGGSSLIAIKKYIAANYKVDVDKLAPFIKKALKSGVASGALVQTKGKGASGSFKLSTAGQKDKKPKAKKSAAKKAAKPKKAASGDKPKKAKAKKPKKAKSPAKKPKAATKAKKAKSPKKPKTPKPKKAAKKTPKKAAKK